MKYSILLRLLFLLFFAGCRVGPPYVPPCPEVPDDWKNPHATDTETPCMGCWWEVFNDDTLNALELQALENNPNLFTALEKVFEARALAGVQAANLYPQLNLNPSYTSTESLLKFNLPPGLSIPGTSSSIPPFRVHLLQYLLPLDLNYEVDLWGKLRDQYDSALFNAEAQAQAYYSTLLTLTADLASAYFQLRMFDAQEVLLRANIETRKKNLDLTQNRFNKGLVTYLDVTQAQTDLATVEASYYEVLRLRNLAEDQIAVLAGQLPSVFTLESNPLEGSPPIIPPGIPSTMLLQRPDIAQAERNMASQHALVDAAYASFFPSLSLTGALGYSSPDLSHFLKWISRYWLIGVNSSQMVFDGGRDCYNLEASWARFQEASGAYQQQVLTAFREVEDALNNIEQQTKQAEWLLKAAESSKKATNISLNRYRGGVAIYLEVVENERLGLQAQINWLNQQGALYVSTIQLIKALGGCWDRG